MTCPRARTLKPVARRRTENSVRLVTHQQEMFALQTSPAKLVRLPSRRSWAKRGPRNDVTLILAPTSNLGCPGHNFTPKHNITSNYRVWRPMRLQQQLIDVSLTSAASGLALSLQEESVPAERTAESPRGWRAKMQRSLSAAPHQPLDQRMKVVIQV